MSIGKRLLTEIETFVEEYVLRYPVPKIRTDKVIHDTLWGTQLLKDYEIAIIDTPLIQRLRQIRQTAFAYFTYPSSTHSRFEHTIGVISQCNKLSLALRSKYPRLISSNTIRNIRMAALLHDCGHGPFSHTSEEIYRYLPEMQRLVQVSSEFEHKNPHEILSYLIIMSAPFKKYLKHLQQTYNNLKINLDLIANAIIKKPASPAKRYKEEIINGPFDADKLDYIFRDSHFSGIKLFVDLDRLWYTANIDFIPEKDFKCLTVDHSGSITLEQILFCKMMLYTTIYHHPKVRACDCMLKAIIEYCQKNDIKIAGRKLNKLISYLYLTDEKIFSEADKTKDKQLHKLIHNLYYRRLLKRALVISMNTIDNREEHSLKLFSLSTPSVENYTRLRDLAKKIWEEAGKPCLQEEIWIDLPKLPHNKEVYSTFIKMPDDSFIPLNKNFPIDEWVKQYGENKWRGHVFCPPDDKVREKVYLASKKVLEESLGIKFNAFAYELSKIPHSSDIDS
jgi:HD superfamily phosphohydrolase